MSQAYYYLVASLPTLSFEGKAPFSCADFLKECRSHLNDEDFLRLEKAISADEEMPLVIPGMVGAWVTFNRNVRNEIAILRASRGMASRALTSSADIHGERQYVPQLTELVEGASKATDPLTAEKILDAARWRHLEELVTGHYFDLEVLIVYALKLKILDRYVVIASSAGKEIYEEYKKVKIPEPAA